MDILINCEKKSADGAACVCLNLSPLQYMQGPIHCDNCAKDSEQPRTLNIFANFRICTRTNVNCP
jgi:hypothetical protein